MQNRKVIIIGAGIAGLSAAMRLSSSGLKVEVYEQHEKPGGKIRAFKSKVGLIDAGPTVLTMYNIFEDLFNSCGYKINKKLELVKEEIIARHWWRDGSSLDLFSSFEQNFEAIKKFSGTKSALEFENFNKFSENLFDFFKEPIIMSSTPKNITYII
ncbi:MAG: phytoene desaturase family protein [Paracoccaceae bacterium]